MKYYTIQTLKAWKEAKSKGYLTGNRLSIDEEWFIDSYTWMMKQMAKRIDTYNTEFPIWLWLDTSNINFNELLDNEYVLLEVEAKEKEVLLSNFDAWHYVLNNWNFEKEDSSVSKEESWEYIFDKEKLLEFKYGFEKEDLQGTIGRIDCKNIKAVKYILNKN